MKEVFNMSKQELEKYRVLSAIQNKEISQIKGAEILELTTRQVRNLLGNLNLEGPEGLISKKRGKPSNRCFLPKFKNEVLRIIQQNYLDFGPTLVKEKLFEKHQITISIETLRSWMTEAHYWNPKQRKRNIHRLRTRKVCFGELIQIDGSHHDWFEGRREKCVLLVFIDDATSKITSLYFAEGESLDAYFTCLEKHINKYGVPRQIYSDRFSVFESSKEESLTHFKYALKLLNISHITAKTPQAKGRVERVNQTLQDRLIKEMRLRNIVSIEEANEFVKEYALGLDRLLELWLTNLREGKVLKLIPFQGLYDMLEHKHVYTGLPCGIGSNFQAIAIDGAVYSCEDSYHNRLGSIDEGVNMKNSRTDYSFDICKECGIKNICAGRCVIPHLQYDREKVEFYCKCSKMLVEKYRKALPEIKQLVADGVVKEEELLNRLTRFTDVMP